MEIYELFRFIRIGKPNSTELIRGYIITRQFDKIKDIPNELLDLYNNTINIIEGLTLMI